MTTLRKVGLAKIKDGKMLMGKDHGQNYFKFVGGKYKDGEDDTECIIREAKEELNVDIIPESLKFLGEFEAVIPHLEDTKVVMRLYKGDFEGEPKASEEVERIEYFDSTMDQNLQTPMSRIVLPWLKENGYIR